MTTSIEHLDSTDDITSDILVSAVKQAEQNDVTATTGTVVGALFPGDHGSGDPQYKTVRSMLNDLADDGTLTKSREGNANAYSLPEGSGDGAPADLDEQREAARNEVLTDPDELTGTVPDAAKRTSDPLAEVADEAPDVGTDDGDTADDDDDTADDDSASKQKGVSVPSRGNSYDHAERIQGHEDNVCSHKTDEHPLSKQDEDRDVCVWWHGAVALDGERDDYDLDFGPLVDLDDEGNIVGSEEMGQDDDPIHISDARFECKHCGSVRTLWHAKSRGEGIWDMSKHSPTQPRNDSQPHFRLNAEAGTWEYIPHADHRDEDDENSVA